MSTPISRNNKLDGLALYAPRHARERAVSGIQAASEAPLRQEPDDRTQAADELNGADLVGIQKRVDEAIHEAINLRQFSEDSDADRDGIAASHTPSPAMAQAETAAFEKPLPASLRPHRVQTRPPRRSHLDPEIVPEPPAALRENRLVPQLLRFSLVVIFAAITAYGVTLLASSQPNVLWLKAATERVVGITSELREALPASDPPSRLIVEDQEAFANEPLSLIVDVAHARESESLLLEGLAQGTTLSAGTSTSPFSWQLPYEKLHSLSLYAPKGFVGVMNTTVNLFTGDRRLLDSRPMQLKWVAREPNPASGSTSSAAARTAAIGDRAGSGKASVPAIEPMDPAEAAMLMQRGRDFLSSGDISAARVVFGRVADAGMADAALALADTYDPDYLTAHNVVGVIGDRARARSLYERAERLGSAEAGRILAQMIPK